MNRTVHPRLPQAGADGSRLGRMPKTPRLGSGGLTARRRVQVAAALALSSMLAVGELPMAAAITGPQDPAAPARQVPAAPKGCRVTGKVTMTSLARTPARPARGAGASATETTPPAPALVVTPLPGATIVVHQGGRLVLATSTDIEGKFTILFTPGQTFKVSAEQTGFAAVDHELTLTELPCDTTLDFVLTVIPGDQPLPGPAQAAPAGAASAPQPATGQTNPVTAPTSGVVSPAGTGVKPAVSSQSAPAEAGRFTQLTVQADANGAATLEATPPDTSGDLARLLPPGFSLQGASADAVTVNASNDAMSVDRGVLSDRMNAIGQGQFDPATGQFAAGFGPAGGSGGAGGVGGDNALAQNGGGRGGGGGGRGGGFALGGRAGRGQSPYQGSMTVNYGGSSLDSVALQPVNGVITPQPSLPFNRVSFGGTIGGPLKIPGLYDDTNRRTNFQINYTGNHSTTLQQSFTTVPTDAMRNGDFSGSAVQLINPQTGQPFQNNQIPANMIDPSAQALLNFIPRANVPGATTNNFENAATTLATGNSISLRLTQNLTPTLPTRGAGGGRGGGGGGGGRGGGGGGGRGLSINLSVQLQYRESQGQTFNVIPQFEGATTSRSVTAPIQLTVSKGRTTNILSINYARSNSSSANPFTNTTNATGLAGIQYPAGDAISTLPLNFGVPNLTFDNFNLRLGAASVRQDTRVTASYTFAHPFKKHQVRMGADFRHDASLTESNSNARGTFTYTGLYTTDGAQVARTSGADVADFLLGLPEQASLQAGGNTNLRERAFDTYLDDNWQASSRLTFSLGIRWEVTMPYDEVNGQMANLDVTPEFTAAQVVCPVAVTGVCGPMGTLSGTTFPAGLVKTDWKDVGPRIGVAYRVLPKTILRSSYSITYNGASYASIARQLVGQPPFAFAETNVGSLADPLTTETGLEGVEGVTTNNYGVDPNYVVGRIQMWNATVSRDLYRNWTFIVGYTGTKGTDLDLLRAPNRNSDGTLRIAGVQPFIWESSGGHSILNLGNFQVRRRLAHGFSGGLNYTLSRSMDNASSLGAGGAVVAQNDQDLAAEYALSNFNQTHNFAADVLWELPFGLNRKWFSNGGVLAALFGEWSMTATFSAHSGSPFTPRVVGATSSVANGTSGSLRANLVPGVPIPLADPSLLSFFNTAAFQVPAVGDFGTSPRNVIVGPGGHVVNLSFNRDMRIGGNRAVTLQVNASNLFNTIQWTSIDTNVNSATFGEVTRFAGMRTITVNLRFRF